jgi:hypothetical protein
LLKVLCESTCVVGAERERDREAGGAGREGEAEK